MKTKLRKMATIDLATRYARDMGDNKITQYSIPYTASSLLGLNDNTDPALINYFKDKEGIDIEIDNSADDQLDRHQMPISAISLLKDKPALKKFYSRKNKDNATFHQFTDPYTFEEKVLFRLETIVNFLSAKANDALLWFYMKTDKAYKEHWLGGGRKFYFNTVEWVAEKQRKIAPSHTIVVAYEESELAVAAEAFFKDLQNLLDQKLLLSYMTEPMLLKISDPIGLGKNYYALFTIVHTDDYAVLAKLGLPLGTVGSRELILNKVGCVHSTFESDLSWVDGNPEDKYEITKVDIDLKASERERNAREIQRTYDETQALAKKKIEAAYKRHQEAQKKLLEEMNKPVADAIPVEAGKTE